MSSRPRLPLRLQRPDGRNTSRLHRRLGLYALESRLAPASFTHADVDGDVFTVTSTKGTSADLRAGAHFAGNQLTQLDLSSATWGNEFAGAGVTVVVTTFARGTGDGRVNVGWVNGTGIDLGAVAVQGDLGVVTAGDSTTVTPGLVSLSVQSLGRLGTSTGAPVNASSTLESDVTGALGALHVKGDVVGAFVNVSGMADGKIGAVTIGGSLLGGPTDGSGEVSATGNMGPVTVGHDVRGGGGAFSGLITSAGRLAGVTVRGSLLAGTNQDTGEIFSSGTGANGSITVGHDVRGGPSLRSGLIQIIGGPPSSVASISVGGSIVGGGGDFSGLISCSTVGAVVIGHDVEGGTGQSGSVLCNRLGRLSMGGSLLGGSGIDSGEISSQFDAGPVTIRGDVRGGSGTGSGCITCFQRLASVAVGGSLIGGTAVPIGVTGSGEIFAGRALGPVTVGGSVIGGAGAESGIIYSADKLAAVTIGGSLIGSSTGDSTGEVYAALDIGSVRVGGDVAGGSIGGATGDLTASGLIESAAGRITTVSVGGSIVSGTDASTGGGLVANASVRAHNDIGSVTVGGNLLGNVAAEGASPVVISARGQAVQGVSTDVAIGSIRVGGRVEAAQILAGYDIDLSGRNADAQISSLTVGGDWIASSVAAGATPGPNGFGSGDSKISGGGVTDSPGIVSRIGSISIGGEVLGTGSGAEFGFVAEGIGAFSLGGLSIPLSPGPHNDLRPLAVATTGDVTIHEI
jgi:hypothetical protein